MKIGICRTSGPRHPTGFTPDSRYNFIVSWERRCGSSLNFSLISWALGARSLMALVIFTWRMVSGTISSLVTSVKTMMLRPKLLKQTQYRNTRLLIIGLLMTRSQMSPISSKSPPLPV